MKRPDESTALESCWSKEALEAEYERTRRVGNRQPRPEKPTTLEDMGLTDPQFGEMW
jgi:hypothetical protein